MADPLDEVLRLVAAGHLTAEEAAPVIDALQAIGSADGDGDGDGGETPVDDEPARAAGAAGRPRALLVQVSEGGRKVVNLRVPLSLGHLALDRIPGLSPDDLSSIRRALDEGRTGPILVVDADDEGDGVRIVLE